MKDEDFVTTSQNKLQTLFNDEANAEKSVVVMSDREYEPLGTSQESRIKANLSDEIYRTNKLLVENTAEDERKTIKLICPSCAKVRFLKEANINLQESQTMAFVKDNLIETTTMKDKFGRKTKEIIGREYFYKCDICESGFDVQVEE